MVKYIRYFFKNFAKYAGSYCFALIKPLSKKEHSNMRGTTSLKTLQTRQNFQIMFCDRFNKMKRTWRQGDDSSHPVFLSTRPWLKEES